MTYEEAEQAAKNLRSVANRGHYSTLDWLALVEDTLRNYLPDGSQLLARFEELKKSWASGPSPEGDTKAVENATRSLVTAASDLIKNSASPSGLEQAVDRAITKGYFKSWPFRFVLSLAVLLLTLITGVSTLKLYDQVQAMKKLKDDAARDVAEARKDVSTSHEQVTQAKAEMALLVLQGDADLLKMRINAVKSLEDARNSYLAELDSKRGAISSHLTEELAKRTKSIPGEFNAIEKSYTGSLSGALQKAVHNLEASKRAWVPAVVWSIEKRWLLVPLALVLSLLAFVYALVGGWQSQTPWLKLVTSMIVLVVLVMVVGVCIWA
jgi:hypothetical protein